MNECMFKILPLSESLLCKIKQTNKQTKTSWLVLTWNLQFVQCLLCARGASSSMCFTINKRWVHKQLPQTAPHQNTCCTPSNCDLLRGLFFVKYVDFISAPLRSQTGNAFISKRSPRTCSALSTNDSSSRAQVGRQAVSEESGFRVAQKAFGSKLPFRRNNSGRLKSFQPTGNWVQIAAIKFWEWRFD